MSRLNSQSQSQSYVSATATAVLVLSVYCVSILFANHCGRATAQEFVYPGQAKSERDLTTCAKNEICSVVHKRYWFAHRVERLCRCDGLECPSTWSESPDDEHHNYTMALNNRAQMKFCEPVVALPNCLTATSAAAAATTAATTSTSDSVVATNTRTRQQFLHVFNETRAEIVNNVVVNNYKLSSRAECFCPPRNIWIAHAFEKNQSVSGATVSSTWTSTSYRCSELSKCKAGDMCGFERTDLYSNYYKCSCPYGHLCLRPNHSAIRQVNEMLYEGPAFVTNCQRKKTKQEVYGIRVGVDADADVGVAVGVHPATP